MPKLEVLIIIVIILDKQLNHFDHQNFSMILKAFQQKLTLKENKKMKFMTICIQKLQEEE